MQYYLQQILSIWDIQSSYVNTSGSVCKYWWSEFFFFIIRWWRLWIWRLPASEYKLNNKSCIYPGECYPSEFEFDRERVKYYNFMTSNDEWLSLNEINYLKYYINNCSSNMTSDPGDFRKSKKYLNLRG